jgi:NADH-quinone oxidoreductase subunit C
MCVFDVQEALAALGERFAGVDFAPTPLMARADKSAEQICIRIAPDRLLEIMRFLYDDPRCQYDQLCDLTCIDYMDFPKASDRFAVTYSLLSTTRNRRLWAKCYVNDPSPEVPSVTSVWKGANWLEREVWDLFGIRFTDHPDLRRIVTWEGFEAHPLRKDYPLRGRGERDRYEVVTEESA